VNRRQFDAFWTSLRQAQGIGLRCIAAIPTDRIDDHPVPSMRSPKELLVHLYGGVVAPLATSVLTGSVADVDEKRLRSGVRTHADLVQFVRDQWDVADRAARSVTDAQLERMVSTPWGVSFSGTVMFQVLRDEFMHHRGQLYVFLRAMNVEPPMMWDFEHNDPEFQPRGSSGG
jgi:uncharacterized damage-inducible protein DinB